MVSPKAHRRFEALHAAFDRGLDLKQASAELGVSVPTARQVLELGGTSVRGMRDPRQAQQLASLLLRIEQGAVTTAAAAEQIGIEDWQARVLLVKAGNPFRRKGRGPAKSKNPERDAEIVAARAAGRTIREIGETYGLTISQVDRIIDKLGGPTFSDVRATKAELEQQRLDALADQVHKFLLTVGISTIAEVCEAVGCDAMDLRAAIRPADRRLLATIHPPTVKGASEESILAALRQLSALRAQERGRAEGELSTVPYTAWNAWRDPAVLPSAIRIIQRFGTWNAACQQAGIPAQLQRSPSGPKRRWSRDDLVDWVAYFLVESSGTGSQHAFDAWIRSIDDAPSGSTVRQQLNGWGNARREAALRNLERPHPARPPKSR